MDSNIHLDSFPGRRRNATIAFIFILHAKSMKTYTQLFLLLLTRACPCDRPCPFWRPEYKTYYNKMSVCSCCACVLICFLRHIIESKKGSNCYAVTRHRSSALVPQRWLAIHFFSVCLAERRCLKNDFLRLCRSIGYTEKVLSKNMIS